MQFHIETERLILRELRPEDAEDMYRMDSHPEVHRYLGNKPVTHISQIEQAIANVRQQYADNGIGRWAAIEKASGHFIGWTGIKYIAETKNGQVNFHDVGYRLHPDYWGKGYATESARAAIKYGFETMNLNEIIGTCHVENQASRNALQKCGLVFVEKFVYDNEIPCDWLVITRQRWEDLYR